MRRTSRSAASASSTHGIRSAGLSLLLLFTAAIFSTTSLDWRRPQVSVPRATWITHTHTGGLLLHNTCLTAQLYVTADVWLWHTHIICFNSTVMWSASTSGYLLPTKEEVYDFAHVRLSVCLSVSVCKITQKRIHGFGWNVACRQMSGHGRTD